MVLEGELDEEDGGEAASWAGEKMAERGLGKKTKTEKRNRDSGKRNDKRNK